MEGLWRALELARGLPIVGGGWAERTAGEKGAVVLLGLAAVVLAVNLIGRFWGMLVTLLVRLAMRRGGFAVGSIQPFPFRLKNVEVAIAVRERTWQTSCA